MDKQELEKILGNLMRENEELKDNIKKINKISPIAKENNTKIIRLIIRLEQEFKHINERLNRIENDIDIQRCKKKTKKEIKNEY